MTSVSLSNVPHVLANAVRAAGHVTHDFFEHVGDSITRSIAESEREREESYLAQSVDIADLECRMHELDNARKFGVFWSS